MRLVNRKSQIVNLTCGIGLPRYRVRGRFKNNHRLIGFGVTKFFPREAFDGIGVVAESIDGGFVLFLRGFFGLDFRIEIERGAAHPLILFDHRQVALPDDSQQGEDDEADHNACQRGPNAGIHFHRCELNTRNAGAEVKSRNIRRIIGAPSAGSAR